MKTSLLAILFSTAFFGYCRSADKLTQICEDNYTECNQSCTSKNARFTTSKTAQQQTSRCDLECDRNYNACLKRQENKSIKGVSDY